MSVFYCGLTSNLTEQEGLEHKTISVWSYLRGSPAALAGVFTNPFFRPIGEAVQHAMNTVCSKTHSTRSLHSRDKRPRPGVIPNIQYEAHQSLGGLLAPVELRGCA